MTRTVLREVRGTKRGHPEYSFKCLYIQRAVKLEYSGCPLFVLLEVRSKKRNTHG